MRSLTTKEIVALNRLNHKTIQMGFGTLFSELIESVATGTPVNAVNAAAVLEVTGVVLHEETVTFDNPLIALTDVYEFLSTVSQDPTDPANIPVDIESDTTHSTGTLSMATQPIPGDTLTIDAKVYTFVTVGTATADGEVDIGADAAGAQANLVDAINGDDEFNTAHPTVSAAAFGGDDSVITALVGGTDADSIATTETFDDDGNVFAAGTLGSGADCTAANAITALATAMAAEDTQGVAGVDGTGDTVDLTADIAGVAGNDIAVEETLTNGAYTGAVEALAGGIDGTVGIRNQLLIDDTYLYLLTAVNTIADANWRRITIGSAF